MEPTGRTCALCGSGTAGRGLLEWYRDPLPTNCVADWVCAGRRRLGDHNLAVFYTSCSSDCLFCQNWHFRAVSAGEGGVSAAELSAGATPRTFCVCFFGGGPASQMPHALAAGTALAGKGVVVRWETAVSVACHEPRTRSSPRPLPDRERDRCGRDG